MFGSTVLDVAIGMAFIYLLLSFVVTAANEFIAAIFKSRGKHLRQGIGVLLPPDIAEKIYDHPLVDGLSRSNHPSYIPSRTFALALVDIISGNTGKLAEISKLPDAINQLPAALRQPLSILWGEAKGDMDRFKTNIEVWFENSMDRVSGWYKRKTQSILLLLGLGATVFLNVDSMVLINHLSHDTSLRAALVASAEAASKREISASEKPPNTAEREIRKAHDDFISATQSLQELNLPIGWISSATWEAAPREQKMELEKRIRPNGFLNQKHSIWMIAYTHFFGWLLTALAISLGAPFWFDILNKFINIRSAGKAPEETPKEPKEVPIPLGPGQKPVRG